MTLFCNLFMEQPSHYYCYKSCRNVSTHFSPAREACCAVHRCIV